MKKFYTIIFEALHEIKALWSLIKDEPTKKRKIKYTQLMFFNVIFLFIYIIINLYTIGIIISSFIYGPIVLLGLFFTILGIFFFYSIRAQGYPRLKEQIFLAMDKKTIIK